MKNTWRIYVGRYIGIAVRMNDISGFQFIICFPFSLRCPHSRWYGHCCCYCHRSFLSFWVSNNNHITFFFLLLFFFLAIFIVVHLVQRSSSESQFSVVFPVHVSIFRYDWNDNQQKTRIKKIQIPFYSSGLAPHCLRSTRFRWSNAKWQRNLTNIYLSSQILNKQIQRKTEAFYYSILIKI